MGAARSRKARSRAVLPLPTAPPTTTAPPRPAAQASSRPSRTESSVSRSTNFMSRFTPVSGLALFSWTDIQPLPTLRLQRSQEIHTGRLPRPPERSPPASAPRRRPPRLPCSALPQHYPGPALRPGRPGQYFRSPPFPSEALPATSPKTLTTRNEKPRKTLRIPPQKIHHPLPTRIHCPSHHSRKRARTPTASAASAASRRSHPSGERPQRAPGRRRPCPRSRQGVPRRLRAWTRRNGRKTTRNWQRQWKT